MRRWIGAVAATTALLGTSLAAPAAQAAEYPNFAAACSASGNSSFTNSGARAAYFTWVWRNGYSVLGYGVARVAAGATISVNTADATSPDATTSTRFGVVKGNGTFAYITCSG